jgi:hypothetical protein
MSNKVIDYNLNGMVLSQALIDRIVSEANVTRNRLVDIKIRNISTVAGIPRLIVDHGQIYNALMNFLDDTKRAELLQYKLHGEK